MTKEIPFCDNCRKQGNEDLYENLNWLNIDISVRIVSQRYIGKNHRNEGLISNYKEATEPLLFCCPECLISYFYGGKESIQSKSQ